MSTFADRMADKAENLRRRLAASLPAPGSKPLPPLAGSTPISSEPGAGASSEKEYAPVLPRVGSDFMAKVNSLIARFKNANKSNGALLFFTGFCSYAHVKGGYNPTFMSRFPIKDSLKKWQLHMLGIPEVVKRLIASRRLDSYESIRVGMEQFEDDIIVPIKRLFPDQTFPEKFFTNLLNEYELSKDGTMYLTGVGGKRRKTRKVRKSKRQTKLRIKKRLTMS